MINLLGALGVTAASNATGAEKPQEGETPFAGLLALLGGGEEAAAEDAEALPGGLADLLAGVEAALADPDLSEAELAAIVGPVIQQLGALLAAEPALLENAEALVAELTAAAEASPEGQPAADPSWRDLSQGLADLQALLKGSEDAEGDGTTLAALLQQVIAVAEDVAQPFVPALPGSLLSLPAEGGASESEVAEAGLELAEPRAALATGSGDASDLSGSGGDGGSGAQSPAPRGDARPAAGASAAAVVVPVAAGTSVEAPQPASTQQLQVTPLAPISATPLAATTVAASQVVATAPQAAVQGQDVLGQIRASASADGKINVELKPEGLGKVEVTLTPDEAGRLQVVVRADQAAVLSALRADRDGLVALLRDAGHAVDDGALSFADLGESGQGGTRGQDGSQGSGGFMTYGRALSEASSLAGSGEMQSVRLPEGSVDIRI